MIINIPPINKKPTEIINGNEVKFETEFMDFSNMSYGYRPEIYTPTKGDTYTIFTNTDSSTETLDTWFISTTPIDVTHYKKLLVSIPSYKDLLKPDAFSQYVNIPEYIEVGLYPYSVEYVTENTEVINNMVGGYIPPNAIRFSLNAGAPPLTAKENITMVRYTGYTGIDNAILDIKNLSGNYYIFIRRHKRSSRFEDGSWTGNDVRISKYSLM